MAQPAVKTASAAAPKKSSSLFPLFGFLTFEAFVIIIALIAGYCMWKFVCGASGNFIDNDPEKLPLQGNLLGTVYKGGYIVPILMGFFLIVVVFSIERLLTISKAAGNGTIPDFVRSVKGFLEKDDVNGAIIACDKQKGSVANVIRATLEKYKEMAADTTMDKDQKVASIRAEVEEATALELPMLERNLPILATLTSVGTLTALLGTVMGMIKAFSALATSGTPDAAALSTGISEALINTALGIATSVIAMILYNYFTTRIDKLTYAIDEAGFSIASTFAAKNK
jgi:biopolymer transport protein ExbB